MSLSEKELITGLQQSKDLIYSQVLGDIGDR
jgi:hypothetical protein